MTTYFTSKAPSRAAKKGSAPSLADCNFQLGDEDPHTQVQRLPLKNKQAKQALLARHAAEAHKWLLPLREGFSVLFYGFGSKKGLLERLAQQHLTDGGLVAFNGFVPTLTLRVILFQVATLLRTPRRGDAFAILEGIRQAPEEARLYVLIHNIDGPGLQSAEAQEALSQLSRAPAVRLLASADHANFPLLWDKRTAARFNWAFVDATTYAPYAAETCELPSLLVGRREALRAGNAATVLATLVPQARAIFGILAAAQIAATSEAGEEPGMTFEQLFRGARERFLVADAAALRSHLTEFADHDLVHTRRGQDGADVLLIPGEAGALQALLDDLQAH